MTADDVALAARVVVAIILAVSGVGKLLALGPTVRASRAQFGRYALVTLLTFAAFTVVLVRRIARNDRRPCNCFGAASTKRDLSIGSLLRNTWFLVLALIATGTTTMAEPSAVLGTVLLGAGFLAVSAVLVVRT